MECHEKFFHQQEHVLQLPAGYPLGKKIEPRRHKEPPKILVLFPREFRFEFPSFDAEVEAPSL